MVSYTCRANVVAVLSGPTLWQQLEHLTIPSQKLARSQLQ